MASICPMSAGGFLNPWKRGGMHSSALPVQTTTYIISENVDIFPNMKKFQYGNFTIHAALALFFYGTVFKPMIQSLIYLGGS